MCRKELALICILIQEAYVKKFFSKRAFDYWQCKIPYKEIYYSIYFTLWLKLKLLNGSLKKVYDFKYTVLNFQRGRCNILKNVIWLWLISSLCVIYPLCSISLNNLFCIFYVSLEVVSFFIFFQISQPIFILLLFSDEIWYEWRCTSLKVFSTCLEPSVSKSVCSSVDSLLLDICFSNVTASILW